jgi:predicted dienelactone hydrolase
VPENDRLVTVARYETQGEAQLAKAQLDDAGIRCMLANVGQSGLAPMFDATEGGVQVKVPAPRADEARALLASEDDGALD